MVVLPTSDSMSRRDKVSYPRWPRASEDNIVPAPNVYAYASTNAPHRVVRLP